MFGWRSRLVHTGTFLLSLVLIAGFLVLRTYYFPTYHSIVAEDQPVEQLQFYLFLLSGLLSLWIAVVFFRAGSRVPGALYLLLAGGLLITAGEEVAWAQRIFTFESPEYFSLWNYQGEVTLHNLGFFQQTLHIVYIATGGSLAVVSLLAGRSSRERFWFLVPARSLVCYYLPVVVFHVRHEFMRLVRGTLVYPYDQEPAELMLGLGVFLFVVQVFQTQESALGTSPPTKSANKSSPATPRRAC